MEKELDYNEDFIDLISKTFRDLLSFNSKNGEDGAGSPRLQVG